MKDNSVKKDVLMAVGSVVVFYLILLFAGWADKTFDLVEAYTLVDIASLVLKVATASAIGWVLMRIVFTQTLGRDFGITFNSGWNAMNKTEKARWIIGTFLVIFVSVIIASK
jgi:hypothetical protein